MESSPENADLPSRFDKHEREQQRSLLEAVIFASPEPVSVRALAVALEEPEKRVRELLEEIAADFAQPQRGIFLHQMGSGYRIGTKPEHEPRLKQILRGLRPRAPLSLAALQTLAIIAYKQPVSAPEIQAIRGVESAGIFETLLKRKLIAPAGRKRKEGHARLYRTTEFFLQDFGLKSLADLPALEAFAEMASDIYD